MSIHLLLLSSISKKLLVAGGRARLDGGGWKRQGQTPGASWRPRNHEGPRGHGAIVSPPTGCKHPSIAFGFYFLDLQDDSTAKFSSGQHMWVVQGESLLLSKPQKDRGRFMGNTGPEPQTSLLHGHPAFTKYQNTSWISQEPILMLFMPKREKLVIENPSQSFFHLLFFLAPPLQAVVVI